LKHPNLVHDAQAPSRRRRVRPASILACAIAAAQAVAASAATVGHRPGTAR
jgi:hypothetical protein